MSTTRIAIKNVKAGQIIVTNDLLAIEEPLLIKLIFDDNGNEVRKSISVTMRTPGNDEELAVGFLFTEKNLLEQLQKKASLMGVKSKTIDSVFIPKIAQRRRNISRTAKPTGERKQKEFSKALIY